MALVNFVDIDEKITTFQRRQAPRAESGKV